MSYFNQILLFDFTPVSAPLVLRKILIVLDEKTTEEPASSEESEEE